MRQQLKKTFRLPVRVLARYLGMADFVRSAASAVVVEDPRNAATFFPYRGAQSYAMLRGDSSGPQGPRLPVPPQDLWSGYATTPDGYLASGKEDLEKLLAVARSSGFDLHDGARVLDFGCASGRMIRWLEGHTERGEVWGVDISGAHVTWCQQNLSPPFRFATTTTFPHLPFEDNYFDLIYAASVFTHISDLAEVWLMELRRIVRPGGRLVLTVHDKHTYKLVFDPEWARAHPDANSPGYVEDGFRALLSAPENREILEQDFLVATIGRGASSQVWHDVEYLSQHWGRYLKVLSITPEAHGYQTAVLLEK